MNIKNTSFILSLIFIILGFSGCSSEENDPDKYITSLLSGKYEKNGPLQLFVNIDGVPSENYGSVKFISKDLTDADIEFINVIPDVKSKEYKKVILKSIDTGVIFTVDYSINNSTITIKGNVSLGKMTIDISQ